MTIDNHVEQVYPVECHGRDKDGHFVLKKPVEVQVTIYSIEGDNAISSIVECQYNTGAHGQRCKASHPDVDKVGKGIFCPYSFDIPYGLERKR